MGLRSAAFSRRLSTLSHVVLDSATVIYHLEDIQPWSELTQRLFDRLASGELTGSLSSVSVAEILVKPFESRDAEIVERCERFLLAIPNVTVVPVSYDVAREAARIRAEWGLRTPDSMLVATATLAGTDGFITNDGRLGRVAIKGLSIVVLDDYVT